MRISLLILVIFLASCEKEHPCHVVIGDQTGTIIWTDCPEGTL